LHTATSKAGQHLNIPLLDTLRQGAPADLITIHGDVSHNFKPLEYPDLVISGGKVIVNHFSSPKNWAIKVYNYQEIGNARLTQNTEVYNR
jgi:hypothetical protein